MIQTNGENFIKFWAGAQGTIGQVGMELTFSKFTCKI